MNLKEYRQTALEQERKDSLVNLIPQKGRKALDIGARDGFFSILLTKYFNSITALDLKKPNINHEKITPVKGDLKKLEFNNNSFDLVFCTEVLEHIPTELLTQACSELIRVTKKHLIIGVPYKQDIRVGRTTCYSCGQKNPPWGHVNNFNKDKLIKLFPNIKIIKMEFIGKNNKITNKLSTLLLDYAGNPHGTYNQGESCISCGKKLISPPKRKIIQRIATRIAAYLYRIQRIFSKSHSNWIHILFEK